QHPFAGCPCLTGERDSLQSDFWWPTLLERSGRPGVRSYTVRRSPSWLTRKSVSCGFAVSPRSYSKSAKDRKPRRGESRPHEKIAGGALQGIANGNERRKANRLRTVVLQ